MENIRLEIPGKCPSKKNMWHPKRGGGIYADSAVEDYVNLAWAYIYKPGRKPISGPVSLDVCFLMDDKGDLDNKISTVCDVLQKCKVIENDRQIKRIVARREKVKAKDSRTFINLISTIKVGK